MISESEKGIGIFDSGVGGLSVLRHIRAQLPSENLLYVADQAHVPYGPRSLDEIRHLSEAITQFLLAQQVKLVVVACNTASGAALAHLRLTFPGVPFVGMEPAIKPAALQTKSGKVGVLATTGTFESQRYANLMQRFAQGVEVFQDPCFGLVEQIESGQVDSTKTAKMLQSYLSPMLGAGVDTVVLGCTHYPFVIPLIEQVIGNAAAVIDPAPAVARQVKRLLKHHGLLAPTDRVGDVRAVTTGDLSRFSNLSQQLLVHPLAVAKVSWQNGSLVAA